MVGEKEVLEKVESILMKDASWFEESQREEIDEIEKNRPRGVDRFKQNRRLRCSGISSL